MKRTLFIIILFIFAIGGYSQDTIYHIGKDTIELKEVNITAPYKANHLTPITFTNLNKNEINFKYHGQEPSDILITTPSITSYSDAGSPYGYSYIRMRGIDQTRINFTLNGVPMNEPEDQGLYFSNYPDFFNSLDLIQIQRGNSLTKNGSSCFGGGLNFDSHFPTYDKATAKFGYGSFNSFNIGAEVDQNFKRGGYYFQLSDIETKGYKYHSSNKGQSLFLNSYFNVKKHTFKIVSFIGAQNNQLAWLGVPLEKVREDRKTNGATDKEQDNFAQTHVQFHHIINFNKETKLNYALYYNYLHGYYTFDLQNFLQNNINYGIDKYTFKSNWYGGYLNFSKNIKGFYFDLGTHGFTYDREHIGNNDIYGYQYTNTGYRNEISSYLKVKYNVWKDLNLFGDVQYRYTDFKYKGDVSYDENFTPHYNVVMPDLHWNFINYDLGIDYNLNRTVFYYSYGVNNREPSRNDVLNGYNYLPCDTLGNAVYNNLNSEQSRDNELGIRVVEKNFYINFNFFHMNFSNEIVLNGKIGMSGVPLHDNVKQSYRRGIEADFKYKWDFGLGIGVNGSYNDCGIKQSNNQINKPILSPKWIGNIEGHYKYKWFVVGLSCRYQDGSIIGYTKWLGTDLAETIDSYYTLNGKLGVSWNWIDFNIYFNNITNQKYFASGQLNWSGDQPLYFVGVPFNCFAQLKIMLKEKDGNKK